MVLLLHLWAALLPSQQGQQALVPLNCARPLLNTCEKGPPRSLLSHRARGWRRPWWQSRASAPQWPVMAMEAGEATLVEEGLDTVPAHQGKPCRPEEAPTPQQHHRWRQRQEWAHSHHG